MHKARKLIWNNAFHSLKLYYLCPWKPTRKCFCSTKIKHADLNLRHTFWGTSHSWLGVWKPATLPSNSFAGGDWGRRGKGRGQGGNVSSEKTVIAFKISGQNAARHVQLTFPLYWRDANKGLGTDSGLYWISANCPRGLAKSQRSPGLSSQSHLWDEQLHHLSAGDSH